MHKAIRYIGSKQKILSFLQDNLLFNLKPGDSFFEGFVGTGIVSQYVMENYNDIKISGGDISKYSEVLFNILNIKNAFNSKEQIISLVEEFQKEKLISGVIFNEFSYAGVQNSYHESRNFFNELSGKTIDTYKNFIIKKLKAGLINKEQCNILLFILISYSCKVANTTSIFGAFLKSPGKYIPLDVKFVNKILKDLEKIESKNNHSDFYLGDIVQTLKEISIKNVIYLDPPYSTRRYESNYHILNYIADLSFNEKILKNGSKTGQPLLMPKNPFAMKKETEIIFKEMIIEAVRKSKILAISYNTDGLIKQSWLENLCSDNGFKLETHKKIYKRFKSKTEVKNIEELEEILWIIKKQ